MMTCDTASCFLCRSCLPEWAALTALHKQTISFRKGRALFAEGDPVTGIYFALSGAVKVHKLWGDGKELIIRFATDGDIIGMRGLGGAAQFPVSATALEPTVACFIPQAHLEASLRANPSFSYGMLMHYAAELQQAEQRMSELAHMEVKGRLARALLALQASFGTDADGFIRLALSRQDIASYAGTIYETVFKIFTEWTGRGMIETDGKRIRVAGAAALQELAR